MELWKEIHPAIRRLLYRYSYRIDEERAAVHDEALQFMAMWSHKQVATEQCVGLVECLWHEANVLLLRSPSEMDHRLAESAKRYSSTLGKSTAYELDDLQMFVAERMRDDTELEELVGNSLLNQLIEVVLHPADPDREAT